MAVIEVQSGEHYKQLTASPPQVAVLNFWAPWAHQCGQMNDVFEVLASRHPSFSFFKIEAENLPEISEQFGIAAVPTFVIVKNGIVEKVVEGANPPKLNAAVAEVAGAAGKPNGRAVTDNLSPKTEATLPPKERLRKLTTQSDVMIFIKGVPQQPRCGFSRQLIELLASEGVKNYGSFDVLSDEEVRQGLKEYSNWPTFPQVYIKGEFVGGLDIVKELAENGELQELLPL